MPSFSFEDMRAIEQRPTADDEQEIRNLTTRIAELEKRAEWLRAELARYDELKEELADITGNSASWAPSIGKIGELNWRVKQLQKIVAMKAKPRVVWLRKRPYDAPQYVDSITPKQIRVKSVNGGAATLYDREGRAWLAADSSRGQPTNEPAIDMQATFGEGWQQLKPTRTPKPPKDGKAQL